MKEKHENQSCNSNHSIHTCDCCSGFDYYKKDKLHQQQQWVQIIG
jgi:hypothetical protein